MIYLVDASVYIFRAYYGTAAEMVDQEGQAVHAVYGFARFLAELMERVQPRYIAVAFDQRLASSFRNRIYPAYKANREPPPFDLVHQFERCRDWCRHLGVTALVSPEYEADDIIGTLACKMRREGVNSALITRDKDLAQLIREGDMYWDYANRDQLGYHDIERHFGVAPERFADYLALTGDAVDNIPGVPGIGPKTAARLMKEFASLDEIYADLERVGRLKFRGAAALIPRLREHRERVYLAQQLTCIQCSMPLDINVGSLRRRPPDMDALMGFYDFHRFGPMLRMQSERLARMPLGY